MILRLFNESDSFRITRNCRRSYSLLRCRYEQIPEFASCRISATTNRWSHLYNCQFQGFDIDLSVIECAKKNTHILDSGAEESIHFKQMELKKTIEHITYSQTKRIVLLSNVLVSLSLSLSHPMDTSPRVQMLRFYHCIMI